ncbi:Sapep family Mn(2+)-dependent dipeptidase [[Mycoplasma] gypis]|uniref:Sapep family Mn(2+)-dependent dipeptidase n=1 Tax=[Mycoplasma] gypis TaxID=92404 RepID=A0ABZ2RPF7_9BACT|nr:Sapep family Mn(2+)-dependent dipeptidase [[Mycoplasma] gypis]MBN0919519.1 Sapep family Mn(2+)-dependent dipeptidase [[Mycoplasma] gypis]
MAKVIRYKQNEQEFKKMVQNIADICAIPSVSETNFENEFPFGKEVDNALNYALNLSKEFGFRIYKDSKNRYGFAEIGDGSKIMGILCHLDVVPSGDNSQWESEAFKPLIKDTEIFGRGTLDDKGPTIITLYAMKYISDNKLLNGEYTIRVIFGLSEETTMESMKLYLKDYGYPDMGYTPDGEWPLIFAEKMIFDYDLLFDKFEDVEIEAGIVYNQIPDSLKVTSSKANEYIKFFEAKDVAKIDDNSFYVKGVAGHGSTPFAGDNAILKFVRTMIKNKPETANNHFFKFMNNNFQNNDFSMPNIFINYDDVSGVLTSNPAFLRTINEKYSIGFDMRVPVLNTKEKVEKDLIHYLDENKYKYEFKMVGSKQAKYLPLDSEIVLTLMNCYKEVTGEQDAKPLAIGGGTYARTFENCVAFGATTKMELMHAPNERFTYEEMKKDLEIYINALVRLQEI